MGNKLIKVGGKVSEKGEIKRNKTADAMGYVVLFYLGACLYAACYGWPV